jgi:hypothetical protein
MLNDAITTGLAGEITTFGSKHALNIKLAATFKYRLHFIFSNAQSAE